MHKVIQEFVFDSAHRVLGHSGKCRFLHGHTYNAVVVLAGKPNNLGMVIDFGELKEIVGGWINKYWDHNVILHPNDPLLRANNLIGELGEPNLFEGKLPYIMSSENPTAENMAKELFDVVRMLLAEKAPGVKVWEVFVRETPRCMASYSPLPIESCGEKR